MHNEWSLSKKKNGIRKRYKTLKHSSIGRKRRKKHPNERKLSTDIVFIETLNRLRLLQLLDLHINDVLFAAILFESLAKKFYFRIWFIEEKSLFSPKCVSRRNSIDFFLACTVSGPFYGYFLLYNWSASILSFIHEMEQKQKQLTQKKNYNFRFVLLLLWLFLVSSLSIRRPFAFPVYRSLSEYQSKWMHTVEPAIWKYYVFADEFSSQLFIKPETYDLQAMGYHL